MISRPASDADGWLHALFRYRDARSGHAAETSFGSHMFNTRADLSRRTAILFRAAAGSFHAPLSPRRAAAVETFCHLIYPVSESVARAFDDYADLRNSNGEELAHEELRIPASGSRFWRVQDVFDESASRERRPASLCHRARRNLPAVRLSRRSSGEGSFSLDHMFGF